MPNDCDNLLTIQTTTADYDALKALLTNDAGKLTFTKAVPPLGGDDWYNWNNEHWGTKWDAYDGSQDLAEEGEQIRFYFATAWSPAVPFVVSVSAMFPASTFQLEYLETGMGFGGEVICVNGVITKDVEDGDDDELSNRELSFGWDDDANLLLTALAQDAIPAEFLTNLMKLNDKLPLRKAVLAAIKAHPNYPRAAA